MQYKLEKMKRIKLAYHPFQLMKIKQLRMNKKSIKCIIGLHKLSPEKHGVRHCTKCGTIKLHFDELVDVCH